MKIKKLAASAIFGLFMVGIAHATPIVYTSRAAWLANTSAVTTADFNAGSDQAYRGSSYDSSGIHFTTNGTIYSVYGISYDAAYHSSGYLDMEGSTHGMSFGSAINALSFDFGAFYDNAVNLSITLSNGLSFALTSPSSSYGFFGITSDTAFTSLSITTNNSFTAFDNVSYGTAAVPEPATLALAGLGVAGVAMSRRRKRVAA
ncbi:PEP-CTERM sorting domain-containing protein [Uliginosibacterium sp. H3]|uniref:PEP-CTERM sorting domain-containing protein n=1 Tax=Uliginosibacterium silvisoli TaxID=3114758 RepID=A0ABU6K444_9RHOO|nr:PEP-CTERM sorting domain-containing protein [Uliginosibacterium sp. H3]